MTRSISYSAGVALAVGALVLAGCGGDDGGGGGGATASTGIVSVADVDGTDVLADSQGKTLYSAPVEKGGKILCVDGCTSFWDPVTATAADARHAASDLSADLGVLKRPGGEQQLTFDGMPLYTFAEEGAGQLKGDGFVDDFQGTHFEWQAVRTDGGGSSSPSQGGGYGY
jgi:predicted lipoprotein with Yx(FWY)xxD motif